MEDIFTEESRQPRKWISDISLALSLGTCAAGSQKPPRSTSRSSAPLRLADSIPLAPASTARVRSARERSAWVRFACDRVGGYDVRDGGTSKKGDNAIGRAIQNVCATKEERAAGKAGLIQYPGGERERARTWAKSAPSSRAAAIVAAVKSVARQLAETMTAESILRFCHGGVLA